LTTQVHRRTLTSGRQGELVVTPTRGVDRRIDGLERPCPSPAAHHTDCSGLS